MDVRIQMVLATYGWQGMNDDQAWDESPKMSCSSFIGADSRFDLR